MKISVIVPIYNVEQRLLAACRDSVVKQTLRRQEYEIILVDDCSTDKDTISMIDALIADVTITRAYKSAGEHDESND